ncbi:MAG TPA: SHOCT domain-containing protein [Limnochorda sp.]
MWWGWGQWPGHMAWYGPWWIGALFMILFWAVLIGGIVWLVRTLAEGSRTARQEGPSRALAILEERFARGEISAEEFRRMREELQAGRPPRS